MDKQALPKGHIVGWVPPSAESTLVMMHFCFRLGFDCDQIFLAKPKPSAAMSKSAKKNEKRKEKKKEEKAKEKEAVIKASWDDDDDEDEAPTKPAATKAESSEAVDELAQELEEKL